MFRKTTIIGLALMFTLGVTLLSAQGMQDHSGLRNPLLRRALSQLELTEEQRQALRTATEEFAKNMIRTRAEFQVAEMDYRNAMQDAAADQNTIDNAVKKVVEVRSKQLEARTQQHLAVRKILNDEQWKKWMNGRQKLERLKEARQDGRFSQDFRFRENRPHRQQFEQLYHPRFQRPDMNRNRPFQGRRPWRGENGMDLDPEPMPEFIGYAN